MRSKLFMLLAAIALAFAPAPEAQADEYDFVGYQFAKDTQRDYDRGFFFGGEAWYVNPKNLHFEPAISSAGGGTIGGTLLDVDFGHEITPRGFLGYKANRRMGTFTLSYWDYNESANRSAFGGIFSATGTHPGRGDVTRDAFHAMADVDIEYAQFDWRHDFGEGRKFAGFWGVGLIGFEIEYQTQALYFNAAFPGDAIFVDDFTSTKAYGGNGIVGGRYHFNKHFSMAGSVSVGFTATEQDYLWTDLNTLTGAYFAAIERQDTELTTLMYEGDASVRIRMGGGFAVVLGYRFVQFDVVIAKDRFVDDNA